MFIEYIKCNNFISFILGLLLSAVISLSIGLYSLEKRFEYSQKIERYNNIKYELNLLHKTNHELGSLINKLLQEEKSEIIIECRDIKGFLERLENKYKKIKQKSINLADLLYIYYDRISDLKVIEKINIPYSNLPSNEWKFGYTPKEIEISNYIQITTFYDHLYKYNINLDKCTDIKSAYSSVIPSNRITDFKTFSNKIEKNLTYIKENIKNTKDIINEQINHLENTLKFLKKDIP